MKTSASPPSDPQALNTWLRQLREDLVDLANQNKFTTVQLDVTNNQPTTIAIPGKRVLGAIMLASTTTVDTADVTVRQTGEAMGLFTSSGANKFKVTLLVVVQ